MSAPVEVATIFHSGLVGLLTAGLAIAALCGAQLLALGGGRQHRARAVVVAAVILSAAAVVLIIGRFAALGG